MSDALGHDRLHQQVGPYRIEVIEPLQKIRLVCDADDHGVGFDLTWDGSFPAIEEAAARHAATATRTSCDAGASPRWARGRARCASAARRSRSTVDRGSAAATARGASGPWASPSRPAARPTSRRGCGFWWLYVPLRFDDFAIIVIVQEEADGYRTLNDAMRVWADGRRRAARLAASTRSATAPAPGTPSTRTLHLTERRGKPVTVEIETLGFVAAALGRRLRRRPGLGPRPVEGRDWVESVVVDLTDPAVAGRASRSASSTTSAARSATAPRAGACSSTRSIGAHAPSGFADFMSVAPMSVVARSRVAEGVELVELDDVGRYNALTIAMVGGAARRCSPTCAPTARCAR